MADSKYIKIAEETIQISKQGHYFLGAKKIELVKDRFNDFSSVKVFDTEKLQAIIDDEDEFFERSFYGNSNCQFTVLDGDSLEAAQFLEHPLVLNFANAIHPGGGFLNGAHAQEESLCRCSTLYQSLSSVEASEMYRYNSENRFAVDSDYMLLSPNVCVFRDSDCNFIENPYTVAVWTMPAPNLKGRARNTEQSEIDCVMKERLRKFFYAAARNGYRNLVLGAWGCGAFGHDAKIVAGYFKEILIEEKYCEFFDNIIFAVLGQGYNLNAFEETFYEVIYDDDDDDYELEAIEAMYPFPICNHTQDVGKENIGYTQGITMDGIPFEAELECGAGEKTVHIILPEIPEFYDNEDVTYIQDGKVLPFRVTATSTDYGVLKIGMVDKQKEFTMKTLENYTYYLEKIGILNFTNQYYNGAMWALTDIEGNDLVEISVALKTKDLFYAECNLNFKPFPGRSIKRNGNIIKLKK